MGFLLHHFLGRRRLSRDLRNARRGVARVIDEHLVADMDFGELSLLARLQAD